SSAHSPYHERSCLELFHFHGEGKSNLVRRHEYQFRGQGGGLSWRCTQYASQDGQNPKGNPSQVALRCWASIEQNRPRIFYRAPPLLVHQRAYLPTSVWIIAHNFSCFPQQKVHGLQLRRHGPFL